MLSVTTLSFDIAGLEVYLPLIVGATIEVASREVAADPELLNTMIDRSGATVMQATPITWRMLIGSGWEGNAGLTIICGGESLSRELATQLVARSKAVWNAYGPTETTIWSLMSRVAYESEPVKIGRPIANTKVYILDQNFQPVPLGVAGQLYIGGDGLARGYVNHPDITAQKFLPNPFDEQLNARFYQTGDLARYAPNGEVEFLGRIDHQIKIRGFRVELGEIEAALCEHPDVQAAVVVPRKDELGHQRLVAHILPTNKLVSIQELRRVLEQRLPDYMVPSAFALLEELPRLPNGKIDRASLPTPDAVVVSSPGGYAAPRTAIEETLTEIWKQVLGLKQLGIHDNFFELGGDSILSIQIVARAKQAGLKLSPQLIFRHQTIAELAQVADSTAAPMAVDGVSWQILLDDLKCGIERDQQDAERTLGSSRSIMQHLESNETRRKHMNARNIEDAYPLSPLQEGLLFHDLYGPEEGVHVTQLGCKTRNLDVLTIQRAWQKIIDRYPSFRTAFVSNVEKPLQVVVRRAELPLQLEDWRGLSTSEQQERLDTYLAVDRRRGFQLNKAPLLRLALFQVNDNCHQLVLSYHHIVVDGWSMALVFKEAFSLYESYREGRELQLEPSPPYREYIAWVTQQNLDEAEGFWRRMLKDFTVSTSILPEAGVGSLPGEAAGYSEQQLELSAATTAALLSLGRMYRLTMNTIVMGAWALLLSRHSGQRDVLFGVVMSGRPPDLAGVESMVGLFVNTLPMRVRVPAGDLLFSWLEEIQLQQLEMLKYEYSPLAKVQQWSGVPHGEVLFETLFAFENFPTTPNLSLKDVEVVLDTSFEKNSYPLTIMIVPGTQLIVRMLYDDLRIDHATVSLLLRHFQSLLENMAAGFDRRLSAVEILTPVENELLLDQFNANLEVY